MLTLLVSSETDVAITFIVLLVSSLPTVKTPLEFIVVLELLFPSILQVTSLDILPVPVTIASKVKLCPFSISVFDGVSISTLSTESCDGVVGLSLTVTFLSTVVVLLSLSVTEYFKV